MSAKPAKPIPLNEQLRNIREQMLGTFQSEPSQTHLTQPLGPFEAHLHARRAELLAPLEHELACVREASWKGADPAAPGADPISHTNDMVRTKLSAALANPEILLYQGVRSVCPEPSAEAIAVCQTQEAKGSSTQADLEAKLEAAQAELEAVKCEKKVTLTHASTAVSIPGPRMLCEDGNWRPSSDKCSVPELLVLNWM